MNETSLAVAIISLLKEMGGWGVGTILIVMLLIPPILGFFAVLFGVKAIRALERTMVDGLARSELIAQQMAQKYDNNVLLVEDTQKLTRSTQGLVDSVLDVIKENTKAITLATARMEGAQGGK